MRLLTASEVADLLGVPASWVYTETRAGRMPHIRLGPRYRRYRLEAIEAWLEALERGPSRNPAPGLVARRSPADGRAQTERPAGPRSLATDPGHRRNGARQAEER